MFLGLYRFRDRTRHPLLLFQCHDVYHIHRDGHNLLPINFIGLCFCIVRWDFYDIYKLDANLIYVANLYYTMNDLRRRQIEDVLDYYKNIHATVMKVERKNVGLTTESLLPYTQLNAEVNSRSAPP